MTENGPALSLEKKLFHAFKKAAGTKPHQKEVTEAFAFFKKVEKFASSKQVVIEVCASHGLISLLFLAYRKATKAILIDPHRPGSFDAMLSAWADFLPSVSSSCSCSSSSSSCFSSSSSSSSCSSSSSSSSSPSSSSSSSSPSSSFVKFLEEDLKVALPRLLSSLSQEAKTNAKGQQQQEEQQPTGEDERSKRSERPTLGHVMVVACHSCAHLTDELIDRCTAAAVDFAIMPCCHRDDDSKKQVTAAAQSLGIPMAAALDLVRMGKILDRGYDCRWRCVDRKITPHNRILIGKYVINKTAIEAEEEAKRRKRDERLKVAYVACSRQQSKKRQTKNNNNKENKTNTASSTNETKEEKNDDEDNKKEKKEEHDEEKS